MKILLWVLLAASLLMAPAQGDELSPGYWEPTPLPQTGLATFYAPGVMEYVRDYRQARGQLPDCPECVGTVALLRAGDVGRKVWLQLPGDERAGPFLVIDCARREDVAPLLARNWAVDVSYELGQAWEMTAPLGGVTVLEDPADALPGRASARGLPTPFSVPPDGVVISAPTPTPEFTPAAPTPWPTRIPAGLRVPAAAPTLAPVPTWPMPQLPAPLTPVVTTPTPAVTDAPVSASGAGSTPLSPLPTATSAPDVVAEVALGRAGGGLLAPETVLTPPSFWPAFTATPRPSARTPRPDLTPILPVGAGLPTPTAEPVESALWRFWRSLIERVYP